MLESRTQVVQSKSDARVVLSPPIAEEEFKETSFVEINVQDRLDNEHLSHVKNKSRDTNHGISVGSLARFSGRRSRGSSGDKQRDEDGIGKGWKPINLQAPVLGAFILFSLSFIIVLEILSHISSRNGNSNGGGVAFAADVNSLSSISIFSYLYLPTIIAVVYSMLWSWVDLDAKRIEPWFQLSRNGGANADDSLLLQYPFDFLPFIPIKAFRRRHWGVFFAGTIMIMVFWILTPLQSAIFKTGTVIHTTPLTMGTCSDLMPLESQTAGLNANFLNSAYGVSWLNQKLPAFSTSEMAFLPFQPQQMSEDLMPFESWSTSVDAYSTNLTCSPANVTLTGLGYTFSNGKGCIVPQIVLADTQGFWDYMINYIGYYDNAEVDWALQNPNCSTEFSNTFLALWASAASNVGSGVYSNLTALFCETSYHTHDVVARVNASNHEVYETIVTTKNATGPELGNIFNITNFEYLLATGVSPTSQRADLQDDLVLQQFPRIRDYSIAWPVSNMVGFAVALSSSSPEDLFAPSTLQDAFQKAHQLLLTTAFSILVAPTSGPLKNVRDGVGQDSLGAIVITRPISIIVEVALGVVSLLTLCLWYVTRHNRSNLKGDPASIADVMSIIGAHSVRGPSMRMFNDDGTLTAKDLGAALLPYTFYLEKDSDGRKTTGLAIAQPGSISYPENQESLELKSKSRGREDPKVFSPIARPLELQLVFGGGLISVIIIALAALVFLAVFSSKRDGISLPSNNPIVLSILENYLPTAFATFIEPIWVILNRLLCLLQPFDELRKGNAKSSATMEASYTSLPPQLVFWRALKSSHFLLAAVCIVAVSSNIMAVALSGLLLESPTTRIVQATSSELLLPQFNGTPIFPAAAAVVPIQYYDHFYVAISNISESTSLPSWVDEKYFYLPFKLQTPPNTSTTGTPLQFQGFTGSTIGFGAESTCIELSSSQGNNRVQFQPAINDKSAQFRTSYVLSNSSTVDCFPNTAFRDTNATTYFTSSPSEGPSALEIMHIMTPATTSENNEFCSSIMVAGWVRLGAADALEETGNATFLGRSLNYTFLSCTPKLRIAPFDVLVDAEGHILHANQTGDFIEDRDQYFVGNASENALFQQSNNLIAPFLVDEFTWHNDSFTSDWVNALLGIVLKSDALVDPSKNIPNAADVVPMVQSLYQKLFAILLGLNTQVFSPSEDGKPILIGAVVIESRLFVSRTMFILSVAILTLHLVVAILYYMNRPKAFLPRMPTSIASIMAFVSASRALDDFGSGKPKDGEEVRYGYGRFIGNDGKTHVGIERQRYVVPLKSHNPEVKKRRRWAWRKDREDEKEVRIWI